MKRSYLFDRYLLLACLTLIEGSICRNVTNCHLEHTHPCIYTYRVTLLLRVCSVLRSLCVPMLSAPVAMLTSQSWSVFHLPAQCPHNEVSRQLIGVLFNLHLIVRFISFHKKLKFAVAFLLYFSPLLLLFDPWCWPWHPWLYVLLNPEKLSICQQLIKPLCPLWAIMFSFFSLSVIPLIPANFI